VATAPRPGVSTRKAASDAAQTILVLTVKGQEYRIAPANLPLGEQEACLKQSGFPFEMFMQEPLGLIKLVGIWWMARRQSGEPNLAWVTAKEEWPADIVEGDVSVELDEPEGSSPEA
jgi:hypothetical protein